MGTFLVVELGLALLPGTQYMYMYDFSLTVEQNLNYVDHTVLRLVVHSGLLVSASWGEGGSERPTSHL